MNGEFERVRELLLGGEQGRLQRVESKQAALERQLQDLPNLLAEGIERTNGASRHPRLSRALSQAVADSLEPAVRSKPQAVVQAIFPIIGPAIRRALHESLRAIVNDLDQVLHDALSLRALRWRIIAWRTGLPYAHVALGQRLSYCVDHLLLIQKDSGLLLDHASAAGVAEVDMDAVAGMLTAIEQFVHDSMTSGGSLASASVGDYRLMISTGPLALVAAFVRGVPPRELHTRLDELAESVHAEFGELLVEAPGPATAGIVSERGVAELNRIVPGADPVVSRKTAIIAAALLLFAAAAVAWQGIKMYRTRAVRAELASISGVVPLQVESAFSGAVEVVALRDALADDPRTALARTNPRTRIDWRLLPFVSSDPQIVERRVRAQWKLPQDVQVHVDKDLRVRVGGTVPFSRWYAIMQDKAAISGARELDTRALAYPDKALADRRVAESERIHVRFLRETTPDEQGARDVDAIVSRLDELASLGAKAGFAVQVRVHGYTDEPGSLRVNRELRFRRAQWLADAIDARVAGVADVEVNPETSSGLLFHGSERAAAVCVERVPLPFDP